MNKINIVYISYDGMTDPLGQSQVLPYLIGLSNMGYQIHLISFEKKERYNERRLLIEKITAESHIYWYPIKYHGKPPVFSTLLDIYLMNNKVKEIISKNNISILHCRSYISALVGLHIKHKKQIPFLFDMRGFWADERVDGKIWSLSNPIFKTIYQFFKKKERQFIIESAHSVSLTQKAKQEIISWNLSKNNSIQIEVIPCCADFNHFSLDKINDESLSKWKSKLGIVDNDFVISYIGSLGTWYMLSEMMDFIKVAIDHIPSAKFLIITADHKDIAMQAAQKANIKSDSIIVVKGERAEVPHLISLSTFSMFFIQPAFSKMASSPTKLAEILGMGIPVLCNANVGDVETIINEGDAGVVINTFNHETYLKALNKMLGILPADKIRLAAYAKKYASLDDGVAAYDRVYKKILNI